MCVWTVDKDAQMAENLDIKKLEIFKTPDKSLYHYTSREVFWKIVDSETLLARHIMFSNDIEENTIGTGKIKKITKLKKIDVGDTESLPFMICFCEKRDLLSQWRGYANEGIALEFDFSKGLYGHGNLFSPYHCFTIMNNDEYKDVGEGYVSHFYTLKNGDKEKKAYFMGAIAAPFHVIYVDKGAAGDRIIRKHINNILGQCEPAAISQRITELIPYIKNNRFKEESEYRLIFNMKNLLQEDMWQMLEQKYVNLEVSGIRKPNIRVRFGNQKDCQKEESCIYYGDDSLQGILADVKDEMERNRLSLEFVKSDAVQEDELIVSNGKYQAEICNMLRQKIRRLSFTDKRMKIWCDGHLPIRRIIVGPSKDAEYMVHSIEEYIKTKYWMRDIKVEASQIPLRT